MQGEHFAQNTTFQAAIRHIHWHIWPLGRISLEIASPPLPTEGREEPKSPETVRVEPVATWLVFALTYGY